LAVEANAAPLDGHVTVLPVNLLHPWSEPPAGWKKAAREAQA